MRADCDRHAVVEGLYRAWMITFMVFIRQRVDESTPKAVQPVAFEPLKVGAEWLTSTPSIAKQSRIAFDALIGCGPKGLPADLLLSCSPEILSEALGVAAIAFISRMVLIVTDGGAAVLKAWFSQPPPVTKKYFLTGDSGLFQDKLIKKKLEANL